MCSALCCDAPVKYVLKEGLLPLITYVWLCEHVVPNIAIKFQSDKKLCRNLGLALLYACMSDSTDIAVPKNIRS